MPPEPDSMRLQARDRATTHRSTARLRKLVGVGVVATLAAGVTFSAAPSASAANTRIATDGFDRSSSSSWGTASPGGSWTTVGGSKTSTSSSAAVVDGVQGGRSFYGSLRSTTATDVTVRATFVAPAVGDFYYSVESRRQANGVSYQGRVRIDGSRRLSVEVVRNKSGAASILGRKSLSTTVSPGQALSVESVVTGSATVDVKARVYLTGGSVPDWQAKGSDNSGSRISSAGWVGIYAHNASTSTTSVKTQTFSADSLGSAPAPAPVAPPPAPAAPPAAPAAPAATTSGGSAAVGSTKYAVPSGAVFVSPSGSDAASGSQSAPVKTVTKALTKAKGGGSIVLRGGTYHEYFIVPPGKNVTIQSYPSEAVWFDGSSTVSGFTKSGNVYRVGNWTTQFDSGPTYSKGGRDSTDPGWQFINSSYPMAAHPDAVWINGAEQQQVSALSQVSAGKFYVDNGSKQLYLGSDPSGKSVQASTLTQAVSLRAPGTTIRGIGFRRYADSVYMQGVITTYYTNQTLENVVVQDSATAGIGLFSTGNTLRSVTVTGSGQIGIQAGYADNLMLDNVYLRNNNDEHFNAAPAAGGIKITTTRGVTLKNSTVSDTFANSVWFDQSNYDMTVVNNKISNGSRYGLVIEISSLATVADNVVTGMAKDGIVVGNSDRVSIWNNTSVNNGEAGILVVQNPRRITQLSVSGHDKRRSQPDLSMPWESKNVSVGNNILSAKSTAPALYEVQAYDKTNTGNEMVNYSNGNVFSQTSTGTPKAVTIWGRRSTWALPYGTLAAHVAATGRDQNSYAHLGSSPVDSSFRAVAAISGRDGSVGQPLPSNVASKVGRTAGSRHLGAWI